jgi:hypothetical protein
MNEIRNMHWASMSFDVRAIVRQENKMFELCSVLTF